MCIGAALVKCVLFKCSNNNKKKKVKKEQQLPISGLRISLSLASEMVLAAITLNRDFPILAANMRFLV